MSDMTAYEAIEEDHDPEPSSVEIDPSTIPDDVWQEAERRWLTQLHPEPVLWNGRPVYYKIKWEIPSTPSIS